MPNESSVSSSGSVFRVDKIVVPADALPTFIEQLHCIQRALGTVPCPRTVAQADGLAVDSRVSL
jgi:hypothetical protein